jgi:hypothetical protein
MAVRSHEIVSDHEIFFLLLGLGHLIYIGVVGRQPAALAATHGRTPLALTFGRIG